MIVVRRCLSLLVIGGIMMIHPARAERPILTLPLACVPQKTCFIQNYVDVDPTSVVGDYACDKSSYDGHKGVDFRLTSIEAMRRGVKVLAVAPGFVKAVRDGMNDQLYTGSSAGLEGRECGNGLVIDHGEGWESQYCHMLKGSLNVKKGDQVMRGQKLGLVGLSGKTAFPHVHLSVRHNGKTVDPFSGEEAGKTTCSTQPNERALWHQEILARLPYISGQALHLGFAEGVVAKELLMLKGRVLAPQSTNAPAMVFYGQALNLQKGDQVSIKLTGPKGFTVSSTSKPMDRHKASYMLFAGKKRRHALWPHGTYKGSFALLRGGKTIWKKTRELRLR